MGVTDREQKSGVIKKIRWTKERQKRKPENIPKRGTGNSRIEKELWKNECHRRVVHEIAQKKPRYANYGKKGRKKGGKEKANF